MQLIYYKNSAMLDSEVPGFVEDARRVFEFRLPPHLSPKQKYRLGTDCCVKAIVLDACELGFPMTVLEHAWPRD